jgi:hypothetical protein
VSSDSAAQSVTSPSGVLTVRPRKIRRVAWVLAPVVVVSFVALGLLLSGSAMEGDAPFGTSDRIAMMTLGLFVAAGILLMARPKLVADADHLKITNIIGGYDLPWDVVRAVRFDRGNAWVNLELDNDDVVGVMAIQAADKDHAVAAVRTLRAMLATHTSPPASPAPPPRAGT